MRRIFTILAVVLMASVALPAMAQETKAPKAKAEKKAPAAKAMRAVGSIVSADASNVTLKVKTNEEKFALGADTKIKLDGKDATAADLKEGQRATVTYTKSGETMTATHVTANSPKAAPKAKATKKEPKK